MGRWALIKAKKLLPDLILCDVNMDKGGCSTSHLSSLRGDPTTAPIPFILMTGLADNAGHAARTWNWASTIICRNCSPSMAASAAVETRLKKAQALREEAEKKLADLRDNISMMLPHELRTPLNGILAYGEILEHRRGDAATDRDRRDGADHR